MQINPYEVRTVETSVGIDALSLGTKSASDPPTSEMRRLIEAMRQRLWIVRFGDAMLLVCLLGMLLILVITGVCSSPPSLTMNVPLVACFACELFFILFGIAKLALNPTVLAGWSMLAAGLQVLSIAGLTIFLMELAQGPVIGELPKLFAAASFAALLSSQAIIAGLMHQLTVRLGKDVAVNWSYIAVIAYAICASSVSSWAMKLLPSSVSEWSMSLFCLTSGIAATVARFLAIGQVIRSVPAAFERLQPDPLAHGIESRFE